MTTQHSPGPWTVAAHTAESPDEITPGCDWTIYGADKVSVCFEGAFNNHAAANVRLIVAAPELLEALKRLMENACPLTGTPTHAELVDHWEYEKTQGRGEADDQLFALAAIAKATGVQP